MIHSMETCDGKFVGKNGKEYCTTCWEVCPPCKGEVCLGVVPHHNADLCQNCGCCLPGAWPA